MRGSSAHLGGSVISCLESDKHQFESLLSSVFPGKLMLLWTSQFICSVQSLSRVHLLATPWTVARRASLSITNSRSLLKLMSIKSVMPSNHFVLCLPLLLPLSIFPSIRVFSSESVLFRWPKCWSLSFNISPSNEHSGLISFRMDWLDLLESKGLSRSSPTPSLDLVTSKIIFYFCFI